MFKVGNLRLSGRGVRPRSRKAAIEDLREFASSIGLHLRFSTLKHPRRNGSNGFQTGSCDVFRGRADIYKEVSGKKLGYEELIGVTLHEIAHWIQYNEGMFQNYFGIPYYGWSAWSDGNGLKHLKRLSLRAERHADRLARRMAREFYGLDSLKYETIYDYPDEARKYLAKRYGWDKE